MTTGGTGTMSQEQMEATLKALLFTDIDLGDVDDAAAEILAADDGGESAYSSEFQAWLDSVCG